MRSWFNPNDKKKIEYIPEHRINPNDLYYYDSNNMMQFTDAFKNWGE